MPLLESKQSRDKCLLEAALKEALDRLDDVVDRDVDRVTHSAWLFGGAVAARAALEGCETLPGSALRKAWGKGDEEKGLALVEVFTLPMVSRWYWFADHQMQVSPERKEVARRVAASNILAVFGHRCVELVDDFMRMDVQFNYERDRSEDKASSGVRLEEAMLVLSKALNACGDPSRLDWNKLRLPAADVGELAAHHGGLPAPLLGFEPMVITLALGEGMRAISEYFHQSSS